MKRFTTILLTICLLYSAALAGSATVNIIEWSWFEDTVTSQTEGSFHTLDNLPCKVWIPAVFEDTEEEPYEGDGFSTFLFKSTVTEDGKSTDLTFGKVDATVYPHDALLQLLQNTEYISDITPMIINGYSAIRCKIIPEGCIGFGAVYWMDDGTALMIQSLSYEDTYDEIFETLFNYISFSVQPAD